MLNRQQALNLPVNLCDAGVKLCAGLLLFSFERGNLMGARIEVVWYFHCDFMRHDCDIAVIAHVELVKSVFTPISPAVISVADESLDRDFPDRS